MCVHSCVTWVRVYVRTGVCNGGCTYEEREKEEESERLAGTKYHNEQMNTSNSRQ